MLFKVGSTIKRTITPHIVLAVWVQKQKQERNCNSHRNNSFCLQGPLASKEVLKHLWSSIFQPNLLLPRVSGDISCTSVDVVHTAIVFSISPTAHGEAAETCHHWRCLPKWSQGHPSPHCGHRSLCSEAVTAVANIDHPKLHQVLY